MAGNAIIKRRNCFCWNTLEFIKLSNAHVKFLRNFVKDIEKGFIKPVIKRIFNLNEIVVAHHFMETNAGIRKIVVLP